MNLTNLKAIFTDILSACSLKKKFVKTAGIYFDGSKIFFVKLGLITTEDDSIPIWEIVDTAELTPFVKGQLSDRSRAILMEFDALDDDILDEDSSEESILDLVVKKSASFCINAWQIDTVAFCLDTDKVVTEIEDLSNIPKDKIKNNVQYQIAVAGNFEADTFKYSFLETDSGVWMEGISNADVTRYIQAFQMNGIQLLALTAMPDDIEVVENIDLAGANTDFLERGGMKAAFAAKCLAYKTNPNFLQEKTTDLDGWNYRNLTAAIVLVTFLIIAVVGTLDYWEYRQVKANLESKRKQYALLESDRRKEEFINKDLAALKERNQIITDLSENTFPWRGLLIHFGTIKIQGVWLKAIHSLEGGNIEIKGEAISYEAVGNYVKALENDSDVFKSVRLKNSDTKSDGQLVTFTIELSL